MKRFPLLTLSLSFNDAVDLWHGKLRKQKKNNRFRNRENIPEILKKRSVYGKRNASEQTSEMVPAKKFLAGELSTSFQISLKEKMSTPGAHAKCN